MDLIDKEKAESLQDTLSQIKQYSMWLQVDVCELNELKDVTIKMLHDRLNVAKQNRKTETFNIRSAKLVKRYNVIKLERDPDDGIEYTKNFHDLVTIESYRPGYAVNRDAYVNINKCCFTVEDVLSLPKKIRLGLLDTQVTLCKLDLYKAQERLKELKTRIKDENNQMAALCKKYEILTGKKFQRYI